MEPEKAKYFMDIAVRTKYRSKDPKTQVGACIVDKNHKILSVGYNCFPKRCKNYPWTKGSDDPMEDKHLYVVHAEANAILQSLKNLRGSILFTTLFPCNECAKLIIQSEIAEVFYSEFPNNKRDKVIYKASKKMLQDAKIHCENLTEYVDSF